MMKCPHCGQNTFSDRERCQWCKKRVDEEVSVPGALPEVEDRVPCPHCAEMIKPAATRCPFCRGIVMSHDTRENARKVAANYWVNFIIIFILLSALVWGMASCQTSMLFDSVGL